MTNRDLFTCSQLCREASEVSLQMGSLVSVACSTDWMLQITAFIKPFTSNQNMDVFVNTSCSSHDHSISGLTLTAVRLCRVTACLTLQRVRTDGGFFTLCGCLLIYQRLLPLSG